MNWGVYPGRFQPFHLGHLEVINTALKNPDVDKVIILIGSANQTRNIRNPFSYEERFEAIINSLSDLQLHKVKIAPINDYNTDKVWQYHVIQTVEKWTLPHEPIHLLGDPGDDTSYYLSLFPEWRESLLTSNLLGIHAEQIREIYFSNIVHNWDDMISKNHPDFISIQNKVPLGTLQFLERFYKTQEWDRLVADFNAAWRELRDK